jgi:hypothetical protein
MVQLDILKKNLLFKFLSCHQVWLSLPTDNRHFWLYHKIDPKKYIGGYPKQQMKMLIFFFLKRKRKREGVVGGTVGQMSPRVILHSFIFRSRPSFAAEDPVRPSAL